MGVGGMQMQQHIRKKRFSDDICSIATLSCKVCLMSIKTRQFIKLYIFRNCKFIEFMNKFIR